MTNMESIKLKFKLNDTYVGDVAMHHLVAIIVVSEHDEGKVYGLGSVTGEQLSDIIDFASSYPKYKFSLDTIKSDGVLPAFNTYIDVYFECVAGFGEVFLSLI